MIEIFPGTLYVNIGSNGPNAPDLASTGFEPTPEFVLCRDVNGCATAIYGGRIWDFNPYRLSEKRIRTINFETIAPNSQNREKYISEIKRILYLLIYTSGGGRLGKLSASVILAYFDELRIIADFCWRQSDKPLVGELSLEQVFSNRVYLGALIRDQGHRNRFKRKLSALLLYLASIGEQRVGFKAVQKGEVNLKREKTEQHAVIPTRLYLGIINDLGAKLDSLMEANERLEEFVAAFQDDFYGRKHLKQTQMGVGGKIQHRPDFQEAIGIYKLEGLLVDDFFCDNRKNLPVAIASIQFVLKNIIHLYTGMRDQEVSRLDYDCILTEQAPAKVNDDGVQLEPERILRIISTTTKYEGYRREEGWLATDEVIAAVSIARSLCRSLAKYYNVPAEQCPLFLSSAVFTKRCMKPQVRGHYSRVSCEWREKYVIGPDDLLELSATDPGRDYSIDARYRLGRVWPLVSHQFRRSLAFYASNSGFVSLPTLRVQFKHLTLQMAKYYRNNFDNLRTIFGYYNEKEDKFDLPSHHVALEFQMGIPVSLANQLVEDLLCETSPLFGGTGSFMEKQKTRLLVGEVSISEVREDTILRVRRGEINYRPTILGGCTKVGNCDSFMLGDITACFSCEGAIIKPEKVNEVLIASTREMEFYNKESGEYQIVKAENQKLLEFKTKFSL